VDQDRRAFPREQQCSSGVRFGIWREPL